MPEVEWGGESGCKGSMEGRQGPDQVSHAGRTEDLRLDSQVWEDIGVVPAGAGP